MSKRLDQILVEHYGFHSRSAAQNAITQGYVKVNEKIITKKSYISVIDDKITVTTPGHEFASRAGNKLYHALELFKINLQDLVILDIGASTGGFSDVCLQQGAKHVYAVDAGREQLIERLRSDSRITCMEGVNARYLEANRFAHNIDFICMDVSFISIKLIVACLIEQFPFPMQGVFLIKPQFEVGKAWLNKNGIVKDKKIHIKLLQDYTTYFNSIGLHVQGICKSSVVGKEGNQEYLIYINSQLKSRSIDCSKIVKE